MEYYIWWAFLPQTGLEQLRLVENETGIFADSIVLGIEDGTPFRLWYQVWLDNNWRVRECLLRIDGEQGKTLHLYADGQGHWTDAIGTSMSALNGCLYIDISNTPFTNTLPIRHLSLAAGKSADIEVAYISIPDLDVRPFKQRYTCLAHDKYRYESVESGFTADLVVDSQGLVVDYPDLWKRL